MRDERVKNKPCPSTSSPKPVRKELPPDVKKALDEVEREVKKEKQR
jgi:predicted DNA-binding transcriptional regulator